MSWSRGREILEQDSISIQPTFLFLTPFAVEQLEEVKADEEKLREDVVKADKA